MLVRTIFKKFSELMFKLYRDCWALPGLVDHIQISNKIYFSFLLVKGSPNLSTLTLEDFNFQNSPASISG